MTAAIIGAAPEIAGPIAELPVRTDQRVEAGQNQIVIERRPYALAVASATAARDVVARQHEPAQQVVAEADAACGGGHHGRAAPGGSAAGRACSRLGCTRPRQR